MNYRTDTLDGIASETVASGGGAAATVVGTTGVSLCEMAHTRTPSTEHYWTSGQQDPSEATDGQSRSTPTNVPSESAGPN